MVVDAPTGRVFTADSRSDTVTVLDGRTGRRLAGLPTGQYPAGLGHDPGLRRLYCGDTASGTVTVIDTDTLGRVGTVPAEPGAGSIAVDAGPRARLLREHAVFVGDRVQPGQSHPASADRGP